MNNQNRNELSWSLQTPRLTIRRAAASHQDIALLLRLWTHPTVMKNVGFPTGLPTDARQIEEQLQNQPAGEYDSVLLAAIKGVGELIGECKLGYPDADGIAHTDIKLLPEYWRNGYGVEIKQALLSYLFRNTPCRQVKATPNVNNPASIRMQQAVGARKTGEGVYRFPEKMADWTTDVPYLEFTVFREDWLRRAGGAR